MGFALLVIVAGIAIFLVFRYHSRTGKNPNANLSQKHQKLAYQPPSRPVLILPTIRKSITTPNAGPRPLMKNIELVKDREDINESLAALTEKYSLGSFTLATLDGLIIASTDMDSAQEDAAQYADMFVNYPLCETPGVVLFALSHKGSDLLGIIRANSGLSDEIGQNIKDDTKDILNSWI